MDISLIFIQMEAFGWLEVNQNLFPPVKILSLNAPKWTKPGTALGTIFWDVLCSNRTELTLLKCTWRPFYFSRFLDKLVFLCW